MKRLMHSLSFLVAVVGCQGAAPDNTDPTTDNADSTLPTTKVRLTDNTPVNKTDAYCNPRGDNCTARFWITVDPSSYHDVYAALKKAPPGTKLALAAVEVVGPDGTPVSLLYAYLNDDGSWQARLGDFHGEGVIDAPQVGIGGWTQKSARLNVWGNAYGLPRLSNSWWYDAGAHTPLNLIVAGNTSGTTAPPSPSWLDALGGGL
jgi:hypothetical protein